MRPASEKFQNRARMQQQRLARSSSSSGDSSWLQLMFRLFATICSLIWLLAVFKVFLLEGTARVHPPAAVYFEHPVPVTHNEPLLAISSDAPVIKKKYVSRLDTPPSLVLTDEAKKLSLPSASEWAFIRASLKYEPGSSKVAALPQPSSYVDSGNEKADVALAAVVNKKKGYELSWPPVQNDGTIAPGDGIDVMPIIGLKVPRFWEPLPGVDPIKVGSQVNGQDTIFLMIASYRDFQCRETITSAFSRADHPDRLYIGAVDQTVAGDTGCLDLAVPCSADPNQPICKYRDQISIFPMDAQYATGPVTARHIGDRMYRGQTFVMQMDAHCYFINHWDTFIIRQWQQTHNEMAVLSSYLTDVQGSLTPSGDSTRNTRPIMCNSDFEGMMPARYLRHGSQPELVAAVKEMPMLQPFWAAGFSFSKGHFKLRVPYDAYQPMVFQGEEIAIGIRGFTHGYDFYAPRDSVVFHEYAEKSSRRKKIPMFWEHSEKHKGEGQRSLRRATALIGMAPDIDPTTYDHSETDRYGLGTVRPLDLFYKIFLIDPKARKAVQLCPFVTTGIMHHEFQKYLRPDGQGIDYNFLHDFDTAAELKRAKKY